MAKSKSTTVQTKNILEAAGWVVDKTEYWHFHAKIRKDLYGGIDMLAIRTGETLGVQATSSSNVSARVNKILAEPRLKVWLEAGNRLEVWGFDNKNPEPRIVKIELSQFSLN